MFKETIIIAASTIFIAAGASAQSNPVATNENVKIEQKVNPTIPRNPRNPRLTPQKRGALNIISISKVNSGYTQQGRVEVSGGFCPETFLLFPEITAVKAVNGRIRITERDLGAVGSANFSASNFQPSGSRVTVQPTVLFIPDWESIGPGYQFTFIIRVDSSAGTNWRTVKQGFYPECDLS